jgi:TPR repeat protein
LEKRRQAIEMQEVKQKEQETKAAAAKSSADADAGDDQTGKENIEGGNADMAAAAAAAAADSNADTSGSERTYSVAEIPPPRQTLEVWMQLKNQGKGRGKTNVKSFEVEEQHIDSVEGMAILMKDFKEWFEDTSGADIGDVQDLKLYRRFTVATGPNVIELDLKQTPAQNFLTFGDNLLVESACFEAKYKVKRKQADHEEQGTAVSKRQRGSSSTVAVDCETLLREGLEWFRGDKNRAVDKMRGQLLIETAAAAEVPLAIAHCKNEGWGGYRGGKAGAFDDFRDVEATEAATWVVAEAQRMLGELYQNGFGVFQHGFQAGDEVEAVKYYRKAAEQGHSDAQCNLGVCYADGTGVQQDEAEAVRWYKKSAEHGNSNAQFCLSACYAEGTGVDQDDVESVKCLQQAAKQEHAGAQCNLGVCYDEGTGVEKDEVEAVRWYKKSAEHGNGNAQFSLGVCYAGGTGVDKDDVESVKWYQKAADQDDDDAQNSLAVCYANGTGVGKDKQEAVRWYKKSAEHGNGSAQFSLGVCYADGTGVDKDDVESVKWYQKAADQGDSDAMRMLAICYRNGTGVERNEVEWRRWGEQADIADGY